MTPYYEHGGVTIYHGDCRDILPLVEADVCITDPPYSAQTHEGARTGDGADKLVDFDPYSAEELAITFGALRVRRWVVATMDWKHIAAWAEDPPIGLRFVRFGIWVKPNGSPQFTGDRPAMGWEGVAILHTHTGPMRWNGGGHHAVWSANKVNSLHPTGKPPELVERFVALFTDPGETIVDPFMGAGTTLRAAKDLARKAIGIEREERYCEIAAERLSQSVLDLGGAA
jgi:site-specific DNA-methyltransferase (adenine-specific)